MKRLAFLLILLVLAGCSKPLTTPPPPVPVVSPPAEAPAPPQPEPATPQPEVPAQPAPEPAVTSPTAYLGRGGLPADWVIAGVVEAKVDEESFDVSFKLPPAFTREQAKSALSIDAPAQPRFYFTVTQQSLDMLVRFPAGKVGEVITVRLGELGYRLTRYPSPRVAVELKREGANWESLAETVPVLSQQPLQFRFRLTGGLDQDFAELKIHQALSKARHSVEKQGADTLLVTVPEPPPLIAFDFQGLKGDYGVVLGAGATVYIGEPPVLVLHDPATGKEERIGEVPPDLIRTSLSQDGAWLMLSGMAPGSAWSDRVWVMSLRTKALSLTPFRDEAMRDGPVVWRKDQLVLPVSYGVQTWDLAGRKGDVRPSDAVWWQTASPDGRYLFGFAVDYGRETPQWIAPASLFVYDTETGSEQTYPDLIGYRVRHSGGGPYVATTWDNGLVIADFYAVGTEPGPQSAASRFVRFDPEAGKAAPYDGPERDHLTWQEWVQHPLGWAYANRGNWGGVRLRAPDGSESDRGPGHIAGWTGDGKLLVIRWTAEQRRVRYME